VAILPQLFMVQKTGEAESITSHYLFALGSYRGLYILNWIYRYYAEGKFLFKRTGKLSLVYCLVSTLLFRTIYVYKLHVCSMTFLILATCLN
jgi:ER lumen protein retaining receptor